MDEHFDKVSLLLTMDGPLNGTSWVDRSRYGHVVTRSNTGITTQTSTKAHEEYQGCTRMPCAATDSNHLNLPFHPGFSFGAEPFTIECWVRFWTHSVASNWRGILSRRWHWSTNARTLSWVLYQHPSNGGIYFQASHNGTNTGVFGITIDGTSGIDLNTWYYVTIGRDGDTFYHGTNGVIVASQSASHAQAIAPCPNMGIRLGKLDMADVSTGNGMDGWLQDVRITKGVARYKESFTPPPRLGGRILTRAAQPLDSHEINRLVLLEGKHTRLILPEADGSFSQSELPHTDRYACYIRDGFKPVVHGPYGGV